MWSITGSPEVISSVESGERVLRYRLARCDDQRSMIVMLTGSLRCTDPRTLWSPLDQATATDGAVIVERFLADDEPPSRLTIHTEGWGEPED